MPQYTNSLEAGSAPPDENTPLLAEIADNADINGNDDKAQTTALSGLHIFALCWCRAVETWIYFSIFPFMPALVRTTGVPEESIGYSCGICESSMAATQFLAMLFWSKWSDSYGRKRVLCLCLAGLAIVSFFFGLANSVWQMVLLRALGGIFSACSLTVRVMVSESTNPSNSAAAYSYLTTATQIALFVAPLAGGALYDPTSWLPSPFFERYPAFLSALSNALISATGLVLTLLFVKETKHASADAAEEKPTYRRVLSATGVLPILTLFTWNWTFGGGSAIFPVFFFTSIKLGGWSFSTGYISIYMGCLGITATIFSLFILPRLSNRYGTRALLLGAAILHVIGFAWPILSNWLLRQGQRRLFWVLTPVFGLFRCVVPPMSGALNAIAPPGAVGMVNGLALSLAAAQGAVTPAAATALFAISVEKQILAGYLAWVVLIAWAVAYNVFLRYHAEKIKGKEL